MRKLGSLLLTGVLYLPLKAQEKITINYNGVPPNALREEIYPNPAGDAMNTPSGFGSTIPFIFGYFGGNFPTAYSNKSDLIATAGVGFGNSYRNVGVVGMINMIDVSKAGNYSASFALSRHLGKGTSLTLGGINLFASKNPKYANDGFASYFAVISHASQVVKSKTPGYSALTYGIGVGTGVFYIKSYQDSVHGRGDRGTCVFANVAYEVFKGVNAIVEWDGLNLSVGAGIRPSFKWPVINIGVTDLTRFSGDKPLFTAGISYALAFSKN